MGGVTALGDVGTTPTPSHTHTMTIDEITTALRQITDQEFERIFDEIIIIRQERQARPQVEQAQAQLITELQESGKLDRPATVTVEEAQARPGQVPPWENPLTDHAKMYLAGAVVAHNERVWESRHPGLNHWEPGAHGVDERIWLDITDRVQPAEKPSEDTAGGVIPFAPDLPVQEGDIVEYQGARYRVLSAHTTASHWPPDQAHALFQRI